MDFSQYLPLVRKQACLAAIKCNIERNDLIQDGYLVFCAAQLEFKGDDPAVFGAFLRRRLIWHYSRLIKQQPFVALPEDVEFQDESASYGAFATRCCLLCGQLTPLAQRIVELLLSPGWSNGSPQAEVCEKLGITKRTYYNLVNEIRTVWEIIDNGK